MSKFYTNAAHLCVEMTIKIKVLRNQNLLACLLPRRFHCSWFDVWQIQITWSLFWLKTFHCLSKCLSGSIHPNLYPMLLTFFLHFKQIWCIAPWQRYNDRGYKRHYCLFVREFIFWRLWLIMFNIAPVINYVNRIETLRLLSSVTPNRQNWHFKQNRNRTENIIDSYFYFILSFTRQLVDKSC